MYLLYWGNAIASLCRSFSKLFLGCPLITDCLLASLGICCLIVGACIPGGGTKGLGWAGIEADGCGVGPFTDIGLRPDELVRTLGGDGSTAENLDSWKYGKSFKIKKLS